MLKNIILILLIFLSLTLISTNPSFGMKLNLIKSYEVYKKDYMSKDGRIIDPEKNNATTSEAQSYMLFMSYNLNDKKTFDLVYNWTKKKLRREDGLFSWFWGKGPDGKYGVLDPNSASDADIDIAFCLIRAYERWKDKKYLKDALQTIRSIWQKETKLIGLRRVIMPGAGQTLSDIIEVNPSYFSPYSFKIFKKYDRRHNWNRLVDSSYYYLNAVMSKTKTGLPPNWFYIKNGKIVLEDSQRGDFSYDAIRIYWRVFADYKKTGEKRALSVLEKSKFFITQWKKTGHLYVNYKSDGQLRNKDEFVGSIAILIPSINLYDKKVAAEIYNKELTPYFREKGYWPNKNKYYARNLLWFGEYIYMTDKPLK